MKTIGILISVLLVNTTVALCQKSLDDAKDNLSKSSSSSPTNRSEYSRGSSSSGSNEGSPFMEAFGELILRGFVLVTYGTLIGEVEPRSFNDQPYEEHTMGEYRKNLGQANGKQRLATISNTVILNSYIIGNDLKLNYRFLPFLGAEVNHLHFFDGGEEENNLGITSLILNFYRIRENRVSGYWGMGATYVGSGINTTGFTYNLGMDIYVGKPVSLGLSWKQAFINESSINEFRALGRYHKNKMAFHTGFVHYQLGGINYPSGVVGVEIRL